MDLTQFTALQLTPIQIYGLVFLLGSFTVSSLSDFRRMAAQKDFAEVWILFTLGGFIYDIIIMSNTSPLGLLIKWGFILFFAVVASNPKLYLRLSIMDVAAIAALFSMLNLIELGLAAILLAVLNEVMTPLLKHYGQGAAYPFLPVVWLVNLIIIILEASGLIQHATAIL